MISLHTEHSVGVSNLHADSVQGLYGQCKPSLLLKVFSAKNILSCTTLPSCIGNEIIIDKGEIKLNQAHW